MSLLTIIRCMTAVNTVGRFKYINLKEGIQMKQKHLLLGIFSIGLVFMMVLAGCEYNGPSVDEISNAVIKKQKPVPTVDEIADAVIDKQTPGPTADEIANAVDGKLNDPTADEIANITVERSEVRTYSQNIEQPLASSGKLTITKGIQTWGQTDVAYTLAVNTAEHEYFQLPTISYGQATLIWEGTGNADIKRSDTYIVLADKSDGKTAAFNFTITSKIDTAKTIKGALTVTTSYDNSTVGVANLNEFFEKILKYSLGYDTTTFTTVKPIASWGQTDVAYAITADVLSDSDYVRIYSPNFAPVLYDQNYGDWFTAPVEWKPPVLGDIAADISNASLYGNIYIGGNNLYLNQYSFMEYDLYTDSTTAKQAKFEFRISRSDQTISGSVTVNIKKVAKTPEQIQQETEKAQLEDLRYGFYDSLKPTNSYNFSYYGGIVSRFIDKDITAFGQTDVLYTISVRGGTNSYDYDDDTGNYIYYGTVNLPSIGEYDDSWDWIEFVTWETKTANSTVVLADNYNGKKILKVYTGKTGTAEFNFTYTNPDGKTVKGSVKVTAVK